MQKSEKIEIQQRINGNVNAVKNGAITVNEFNARIMTEIELVYEKAKAEAYKEIVIDLKKLDKGG